MRRSYLLKSSISLFILLAIGGYGFYLYSNYAYQQAYHNGYANGHKAGYTSGEQDGYNKGKQDGYNVGWEDGDSVGYIHGQMQGAQEYIQQSCVDYPFLLLPSDQYWACRKMTREA